MSAAAEFRPVLQKMGVAPADAEVVAEAIQDAVLQGIPLTDALGAVMAEYVFFSLRRDMRRWLAAGGEVGLAAAQVDALLRRSREHVGACDFCRLILGGAKLYCPDLTRARRQIGKGLLVLHWLAREPIAPAMAAMFPAAAQTG